MTLTAELRPIARADAPRLRRFHSRLSTDTVYSRYHGFHPALGEAELRFLVGADGAEHVAWVACDGYGELLGVCRVIGSPDHPGEGEVAIVVADGAQGGGVGHKLLHRVLDDAERAGFRSVQALILDTNTQARRLFVSVAEERGIPWCAAVSGGVVDVDLQLQGPD